MKRAVLACAVAAGLVIGAALPSSAIGLTQVTLSCDDGTSVTLVVDTDTLASLTASVQGMLDYPAGLTCTLVQSPLPLAFGAIALASPGSNQFIVAGGRWEVPCDIIFPLPITPAFAGGGVVARVPGASYSLGDIGPAAPPTSQTESVWVNIAVNVHKKDSPPGPGNPPFFGTLNETIPGNQSCGVNPVRESHFTSKPTCLLIVAQPTPEPPKAFVTSEVTQISGAPFPADGSGAVGTAGNTFVHFGFQDNGNPPGQNPIDSTPSTDMLAGPPATPEGSQMPDCNPLEWPPIFHLGAFDGSKQYGNINVHPGS
ncbi:MAG: hypothetical protein E6I18_10130 [Chloroflexi bacterium]|nr:MAG: hypothetical protein E6I18_10130 [Chloroflexota bacterium]